MPRPRPPFIEHGSGELLVLVPGIQGRWEWMRPTVGALARSFRVVTFSLPGEPGSKTCLPDSFEAYFDQLDAALAFAGREEAIVCGVSYGGLIAVSYAAARPNRVGRLVLVSTPSPSWEPDARVRRSASAPRTSGVAFLAGAPRRLSREVAAAIPDWRRRAAMVAKYLGSILANPCSPVRMAGRVRRLAGRDFVADSRIVRAPTLVVTGEPALDRVVPVAGTREYLALIRGAVGATLERTGHIGVLTRPEAFADMVYEWSRAR